MIVILILPVIFMLQVIQQDHEHASQVFFQSKQGLNHAVHAATQQMDSTLLREGVVDLNAVLVEQELLKYIKANLIVDDQLSPLIVSFLKDPITNYKVIYVDHLKTFPYTLQTEFGDKIRFDRPGIYLQCRIRYPKLFGLLPPIQWDVRCAGQVVPLPPR
jgi:hypothetical protein